MNLRRFHFLISAFVLVILPSVSFSAAYLDSFENEPYVWRTFPIVYRVDNATIKTVMTNAASVWESSTYGSVSFLEGADHPDINLSNYESYLEVDSDGVVRTKGNETLIIHDEDGDIIDDIFGAGASNEVLGIASPGVLDSDTLTIVSGFAIVNGKATNAAKLTATMTHELGHLLNLAHSQLNFDDLSTEQETNLPTMIPILPIDASTLLTLELDDQLSLGYLYPSASFSFFSTIQGKIRRRNGEGVRAVNVICRDTENPRKGAVSWISDQNGSGDGDYFCGALSAGNYTVEIEPIFTAINVYDPIPPYIATEFYSGPSESYDPALDDRADAEEVVVDFGENVSDVDIILNEDGRIFAAKTVSGRASAFSPADLEYFIRVPKSATEVRFTLDSEDNDVDLDILGRCDGEFSLTYGVTSPNLIPSAGTDGQAEFWTRETTGDETLRLSSNTTPKLEKCTYHILIVNFSPDATNFTLRADITGTSPKLSMRKNETILPTSVTGSIIVADFTWLSEGDEITLSTVDFDESGKIGLDGVRSASLYLDENDNGEVDEDDILIKETSFINPSDRTVLFTNLDFTLEEGDAKRVLLQYEIEEGNQAYFPLWILLGFFGFTFRSVRRRTLPFFLLIAGPLLLSQCGGGGSSENFEPKVIRSSVEAFGLSYGEKISIETDKIASVKDFFY